MIEFLLGLGVGYFLSKGLKYIIAFFAMLIIGDLLNAWRLSSINLSSVSNTTNVTFLTHLKSELTPLMSLAYLLAPIFTDVVVLVGFIVGALIAFLK